MSLTPYICSLSFSPYIRMFLHHTFVNLGPLPCILTPYPSHLVSHTLILFPIFLSLHSYVLTPYNCPQRPLLYTLTSYLSHPTFVPYLSHPTFVYSHTLQLSAEALALYSHTLSLTPFICSPSFSPYICILSHSTIVSRDPGRIFSHPKFVSGDLRRAFAHHISVPYHSHPSFLFSYTLHFLAENLYRMSGGRGGEIRAFQVGFTTCFGVSR